MPIKFNPKYAVTNPWAFALLRLEGAKERINGLPITPAVLARLRETARLASTHYSTQIEGNRLSEAEVKQVLAKNRRFPGRARDEKEIKGYYSGLTEIEQSAKRKEPPTEMQIQRIHGLVMGGGKTNIKPTPYRDGQNVIKDGQSGRIVYMPPEAKDVPPLMAALVEWLNAAAEEIPCPLRAAIVHYQFATVHPYDDGNGRTARLLTNLILHRGGYGLKGIYSLEEYYARDLQAYYDAIAVGPLHNYYAGREKADITGWLEYFAGGMADAFAHVEQQAEKAAGLGEADKSPILRTLDPRQRKALTLFAGQRAITSRDLARLFSFAPRTARVLLQKWTRQGFLKIIDPSKKARKYELADEFEKIFEAGNEKT
ncbi:MAG: cell filamentation protein Fic [Acidobacteria bacterium RIFCSPLOWO2_12_FULL_59_11]|nr:MAG: cell filamentation protein Fic [Acidobacteria bacterium RIFCSPLOWO2_12_FULL_59_11]